MVPKKDRHWIATSLTEAFHSFEACLMSQCSMKDKETKALKYTRTGIPDALVAGGQKKITNYPPTFSWEQEHRNHHTWAPRHPVHTAWGGDCPTNAGVGAAISQTFSWMCPVVQPPPVRRDPLTSPLSVMGYVGPCTYTQMHGLTPTCSYCVQARCISTPQSHRLLIGTSRLIFVI